MYKHIKKNRRLCPKRAVLLSRRPCHGINGRRTFLKFFLKKPIFSVFFLKLLSIYDYTVYFLFLPSPPCQQRPLLLVNLHRIISLTGTNENFPIIYLTLLDFRDVRRMIIIISRKCPHKNYKISRYVTKLFAKAFVKAN